MSALRMPNRTKSHNMTIAVMMNAVKATIEAMNEPKALAPRVRMKAMNERTVATGWSTKARVRALVVDSE